MNVNTELGILILMPKSDDRPNHHASTSDMVKIFIVKNDTDKPDPPFPFSTYFYEVNPETKEVEPIFLPNKGEAQPIMEMSEDFFNELVKAIKKTQL